MRNRFFLSVTLVMTFALSAMADDFELMRQHLRERIVLGETTTTLSDPQMKEYVTNLNKRAISYRQTMRKDTTVLWNDLKELHNVPAYTPVHLNSSYSRLLEMSRAWAYPGGTLYQDETLLADIRFGLDLLYKEGYNKKTEKIGSWWEWRIGIPWSYAHIVSILYEQLTPEEIAHYEEGVAHFIRSFTKNGDLTWANKASICRNLLLMGILTNSKQDLQDAMYYCVSAFCDKTTPSQRMSAIKRQDGYVSRQKYLRNVSLLANKEGLYQDGTFIQHNCIPYIGTYGLEIIQMAGYLCQLLEGTQYSIPQEIADVLPIWINKTYLPSIYHGEMLLMLMGRANASDPYNNARMVALSIIDAADLIVDSVSRQETLTTAANIVAYNEHYSNPYSGLNPLPVYKPVVDKALRLASEQSGDIPFSVVWAAGDRVIHQTDRWRVALSMSSNRIGKYESFLTATAKQNNTGWYTSDGMTYLYLPTDAKQYYQYMLNINPYRVPGTTVDMIERKEEATTQPMYGNPAGAPKNARAGGAKQGMVSSAMMQLLGGASNLTAKKSWFFFDNEVVCLGADINLDADREVITTVENRRFKHPLVLSDGKTLQQFNNQVSQQQADWACLETIGGYYFPEGATLNVNQTDNGNTEIWFTHGNAPQQAHYAYYLLPAMNTAQVKEYAAAPAVTILANTSQLQAVEHKEKSILAVNFWTANTLAVDDLALTSDGVAAVILKQEGNSLTLSVADPTWDLRKQTLTLNGVYQLAEADPIGNVKVKVKGENTIVTINQDNRLGMTQQIVLTR